VDDQGARQRTDDLVGGGLQHKSATAPDITTPTDHKPNEATNFDAPRSISPVNEYEQSNGAEKGFGHNSDDTAVNGTDTDSTRQRDGHKKRSLKGLLGGKSTDRKEEADDNNGKDKPHKKFTVGGQIKATLFNSWINVLLIASPIGIILHFVLKDQPIAIFVINFIAIIPLAALLSYATEEIALRTGEVIGGLLNASFGNAVELIVSIIALVKDQTLIVQTSLIGSMLSNLLLVMGMCFFFGGINRFEQNFNMTVAQTAASLLFLSVASLLIPTAFDEFARIGDQSQSADPANPKPHVADLSRGTSIMLLLVYACYLFFQLKSHNKMFSEVSEKADSRHVGTKFKERYVPDRFRKSIDGGRPGSGNAEGSNRVEPGNENDNGSDNEDEPEEPQLSIWVAVGLLAASTVLVALNAEFLVDSINDVTCGGGISKNFVGLILLPIVGNAAEHATAVTVAIKDKMDLAIGVAVGSSMQIALLVLPFTVVLGWIIGKDDMTLFFDGFQITVLFVTVLLVNYLIQDGKSHWLEGVLLMTLYIIIAIAAWYCKLITRLRYAIKGEASSCVERTLTRSCRPYFTGAFGLPGLIGSA
jgi:Ca2+:H+ antiporter